jgi:hypothetical protein
MNATIKRWLGRAGRNRAVWLVYRGLNSAGQFIARCLGYAYQSARISRLADDDALLATQISPALTVLAGPFRGMRYPRAQSTGSTLVPKLLGSYERELHAVVENLVQQEYSCVVDIGCAEGYYAVGFALRLPRATILAFDTDPKACALCLEMARLNGVAERVKAGGLCDEATLLSLPLGDRALVISDCEGYEITLFSARAVAALARHTLLIEVHDFFDEDLGEELQRRFEKTHHLTVIPGIDDRRKANDYANAALEPYSMSMRRRLLAERRGFIMQWFLLTPRSRGSGDAPDVPG